MSLLILAPAASASPVSFEQFIRGAKSLCLEPTLYGYSRSAGGELRGELNLPMFFKRMADLGFNVKVHARADDWKNVLQRDLAQNIFDYRKCVQNIVVILPKIFPAERSASRVQHGGSSTSKAVSHPETREEDNCVIKGDAKIDAPTTQNCTR